VADRGITSLVDRAAAKNLVEGCDLRGVEWPNAYLAGITFRHCDLRRANWRGVCLRGAVLRETDLRHADLCRANLQEATLRGCILAHANLRHADLRGAHYDRFTRWPAGFRPEEHGARLVE
jgi:uncharacterized protein YjbI with pentapeptide repeats